MSDRWTWVPHLWGLLTPVITAGCLIAGGPYMALPLVLFLGVGLFKPNDPWHFGTLHITFVTLFRCATLEDWTDVMYINIYGCDKYGYADSLVPGIGVGCETPKAQPLTVLYFLIFQVLGALVLLTLFIGVVTTAMEEATSDDDDDDTGHRRTRSGEIGRRLRREPRSPIQLRTAQASAMMFR